MSRIEKLREVLAKRECEAMRARFRAAEHETQHGPDHPLVMRAWLDVADLETAVSELQLMIDMERPDDTPMLLAKQAC